ncbi:uncharacterized protein LOC113211449 isoform X1 [Frankliniella occidentalis]|uniref:Uncharacterized protein LOC113211449 isoform X1 n=1 Tax=Frankliniella occidentalis TaxID=133901 RepID=A0A6J1SXK6_FRAOC|nr:uncharacterized protein LOC113211449 isoform X1 [Frankliniella occidentalis]
MAHHITTQLLAVVLVSLAACGRSQRVYQRAPYHFFYPPQRGYVQQVATPVQLQNAPAFTQTVYVVVEDDGSGGPDDAEQRRLLDAIPSLLEMLSTGGAGGPSFSGSPPPGPGHDLQPTTAPKTVFLDDVEPEFDKDAWQQSEAGQEAAAAPEPVDKQTQDDATPSPPPLEYPKDSYDTRPDYAIDDPPIDVRSGFTGGKSRAKVNPQEPTL